MRDGYITVYDRHFTGGDDEENNYGELNTSCRIGAKNGAVIIEYTEILDGENDCRCVITVTRDRITMIRSGVFRTTIIFENQKRNACAYHTPYGEILIGVYTNAVFSDMSENGGTLNIAYTLDSSGDLLSENELRISVELKED